MLRLLPTRSVPARPDEAERGGSAPAGDEADPQPEDELRGLVRAALRGSRHAERTLLTNLGPSMLQMVRRVLGPRDPDVEDVFQDAALGFVRALPGFRETCSTRHFACRVALLTALKARRRRPSARGVLLSMNAGDLDQLGDRDAGFEAAREAGYEGGPEATDPGYGADPADSFVASSQRDLLRHLLDELPETQATALLLHCVGGFTLEEVAASMAVPLETARSRLRLAKSSLRQMIAADPVAAELLEVTP
jgi:RNA polymerase sigma-70 factor (ECF subfamily)